MEIVLYIFGEKRSLPSRGGWIEIDEEFYRNVVGAVPPLTGRVD